jgi:hypothetical protein
MTEREAFVSVVQALARFSRAAVLTARDRVSLTTGNRARLVDGGHLMVTVLPEESLLLAARLLQTAADQAEDDTRTGRATYVAEGDVKVLLWLCGSLLGEGRELRGTSPAGQPLRVLLQEAETELRRFPIGDYPAGTLDVVVGLCDLIRGNRT